MAVVSDASDMALDGVLDAAFAGRTGEIETEFAKARAGGSSPAAILSAAIRHVANLHKMRLAIDGGDSIDFAMKRGAPPVHFTREKLVGDALRALTRPRLLRAMAATGGRFARSAPQRAAGRNHRAAHAAVDRGGRATARQLASSRVKRGQRSS